MNASLNRTTRFAAVFALVLATATHGQNHAAKDRQPTPDELAQIPAVIPEKAAELIRDVRVPEGFFATIFATPPAVNYPVFVAAATDGTLYVSSDGNGSLDRKPHLGRVLRVRDTNGDGQADEVKAFVPDVDSPRGLVWDHDRLYLLHPPDISEFVDRDGDGVFDEKRTLVRGIGWTFKDRPADHGSNGLELGMDGWLYAAIGDFGFMEAVGTDGRRLQLRGGGVVRVRPDGSNLELFADGTRNIVEAAVGPELDAFARDNTNDGGGWDVRLHHFSGDTQHGYPRLFKNFRNEIIEPLADYGGGSGCGAGWVDEPGFPAEWNNAPFTADWGRDWIYHHGLTPKGATFAASQKEFVRLPRVTDLDVDGDSAVYAASWKGASFTWVGQDVGFIARISPKGYKAPPLLQVGKVEPAELIRELESPSHRRRMEAQRACLRRSDVPGTSGLLRQLVANPSKPLPARIAALFTLQLKDSVGNQAFVESLGSDVTISPWIARAIGDQTRRTTGSIEALKSILSAAGSEPGNPRARKEAVIALGKLGSPSEADLLIRFTADSDPVVAQAAVHALVRLGAVEACLRRVGNTDQESDAIRTGCLRVLQRLHQSNAATGLIGLLESEKDDRRRQGLLTTLCRLHFREGKWKGDSWGTRPDTRGPYYDPAEWDETARISKAIKGAFEKAGPSEAAFIGRELARHRIPAGDTLGRLIARASGEPSLLPALASQLSEAEEVPAEAIPLLAGVATSVGTSDAARAQAVIAMAKTGDSQAWQAILKSLPQVQATKTENNLAEKARSAVGNAARLDQVHGVLEEAAAQSDGAGSALAEGLLLKLASRKAGAPEARDSAIRSIDAGWNNPRRKLQIMRAAAQVGDARLADRFVTALNDPDSETVKVANETIKRLKIDPVKFRADAGAPKLASLPVETILSQIMDTKGEISRGEQLFTQTGCNGCHTVKADESLKGPFLGTIATVYKRRELAEAILIPSKTIAQGFVANHFELKDGSEIDGFVVREAADLVTIRTIAAAEQAIPVAQIVKREKQERSLMPEGLAADLTVRDFASILDYLESLAKPTK